MQSVATLNEKEKILIACQRIDGQFLESNTQKNTLKERGMNKLLSSENLREVEYISVKSGNGDRRLLTRYQRRL